MQTFLPYPDFARSAASLDRQRLGKQRVENLQILRTLTGASKGWANHPVVRMWCGYEAALLAYQGAVCAEWTSWGYRDTCLEKSVALVREARISCRLSSPMPEWMGDERLHTSHRAALLRKMPEHYGRFGWLESPEQGYWWPRSEENRG